MDNLGILFVFLIKSYPLNSINADGIVDYRKEITKDQRAEVEAIVTTYLANPDAWVEDHRLDVEVHLKQLKEKYK